MKKLGEVEAEDRYVLQLSSSSSSDLKDFFELKYTKMQCFALHHRL